MIGGDLHFSAGSRTEKHNVVGIVVDSITLFLSLVFLVFFIKRGEKKFRKGISITVLILMATHKL